ncbi:MAG: hypothetical protein ACREQI_17185 [Candidatus Binataceae bacterium]
MMEQSVCQKIIQENSPQIAVIFSQCAIGNMRDGLKWGILLEQCIVSRLAIVRRFAAKNLKLGAARRLRNEQPVNSTAFAG